MAMNLLQTHRDHLLMCLKLSTRERDRNKNEKGLAFQNELGNTIFLELRSVFKCQCPAKLF